MSALLFLFSGAPMKLAEALLLRADLKKKLLSLRERIGRSKYIPEDQKQQFTAIEGELASQMAAISERGEL